MQHDRASSCSPPLLSAPRPPKKTRNTLTLSTLNSPRTDGRTCTCNHLPTFLSTLGFAPSSGATDSTTPVFALFGDGSATTVTGRLRSSAWSAAAAGSGEPARRGGTTPAIEKCTRRSTPGVKETTAGMEAAGWRSTEKPSCTSAWRSSASVRVAMGGALGMVPVVSSCGGRVGWGWVGLGLG